MSELPHRRSAVFLRWSFALLILTGCCQGVVIADDAVTKPRSLTLLVMDPLAEPLSCACVPGFGQRQYDRLAKFLSAELERPVDVVFEESLGLGKKRARKRIDFIIGKRSMVEFDAKREKTQIRRMAQLTDRDGKTTVQGAFVVKRDSSIRNLDDLKGRKLLFGPKADAETNAAAVQTLAQAKLEKLTTEIAGSIEAGVYAVSDGEADATVITDYLPPLLEGCGKIAKGELRIIATTKPIPFVEVFAAEHITADEEQPVRKALERVRRNADLLKVLESKKGFLLVDAQTLANKTDRARKPQTDDWTDWRGPNRDGQFEGLPESLPKELTTLWTAKVTGPALAGIAATDRFVVVADKDADLTRDIFRGFNAKTGAEVWTLDYPAETKLEYTNAPRATPVISEGLVYLQGALGDLHCVELATGKIVWQKHFGIDFGAERPNWGWSSPPLVVDEKLIINPGGKDVSLAALDRKTGKTLWKTPGHAAAYSAFLLGTFSGVRQIVGYDVAGLGGWDPQTGKRLWEVIPPRRSDFNVGTPLILGNQLLVATENNATRIYEFDKTGKLQPQPIALNDDLAPDTCSPVISGDRIFCSGYGELYCLDRKQNLKTVWAELNDFFYDHTNIIAGKNRILVWTTGGDLLLIAADKDSYTQLAHIRPFGKRKVESTSHPALMKDRIYLRDSQELKCLTWKAKP